MYGKCSLENTIIQKVVESEEGLSYEYEEYKGPVSWIPYILTKGKYYTRNTPNRQYSSLPTSGG